MYTGTLIDDLITMVERAETRAHASVETAELERWFVFSNEAPQVESDLLGVA